MRTVTTLLVLLCLTLGLTAQTVPQPGLAIACVAVKTGATAGLPYNGEIYLVDPANGTAAALTVPTSIGSKVGFNAIFAVTPASGYVTTIDGSSAASPASAGDLYRYVLAPGMVNLTKLNTTAFAGGNLSQVCQIGGTVYVATQDAANTNGMLCSVPASGGPVTTLVDFGKVTGYGGGLINACTAMNGKVYLAAGWGTGADELWEYDPVAKTTTLFMTLPAGVYTTKPYAINLTVDTAQNLLVLVGVYRDVFYIDLATKKVVHTYNAGKWQVSTSKYHYHQTVNAGHYNPDTGDILIGTRVGSLDIFAGSHGTLDMLGGVGSSTTASYNSVTGMAYIPTGGHAMNLGTSGMGSAPTGTYRFFPVNVSLGTPRAGMKWGTLLHGAEGGAAVILAFGLNNKTWAGLPLPFDLGPFGASGSMLYCDQIISVPGMATGTGPGMGTLTQSFTMPTAALGATLYCQWMVADLQANALRLVTTNARELKVK